MVRPNPRSRQARGGVGVALGCHPSSGRRKETLRRVYGIAAVPRARVHLVTNERLCAAASVAYAKHAGPGADKKPPFAVAVAAADDLFVVELGETAGRDAPYWEVVIFDRKWRRIASYGGGS